MRPLALERVGPGTPASSMLNGFEAATCIADITGRVPHRRPSGLRPRRSCRRAHSCRDGLLPRPARSVEPRCFRPPSPRVRSAPPLPVRPFPPARRMPARRYLRHYPAERPRRRHRHTPRSSRPLATKSVSELISIIAAVAPLALITTRPSAATRPDFLSAFASGRICATTRPHRPCRRRSRRALSCTPSSRRRCAPEVLSPLMH